MATLAVQPEETRTGLFDALRIMRNLWMRCGPRYALLWLLQGTLCRALSLRVLHICIHEAGPAVGGEQCLPSGYELRLATPEELARGVPDDPSYPDPATLRRYLAAGDLMIAVFHGGRIVSYGWCSSGPAAIGGGLTLRFSPRFLYGHRAYTSHRHRGKGLHAAIIAYSRHVAAQRGQSIVAYVDANNHRSLISESRIGPIRSGLVVVSLRSERLRYWASGLCRQAGLVVSKVAKP
ncbi:MAG TPA: GNAT family N-acetyltransferase [Steroidobacteraceae bacterium]|nr:GNAT family N-acetyltransferase [Steroidobacteraceae bacterium]